ncbi:MAG: L-threonylcarbamoyladenylate synthase [Candidatus Pacebacteria bacterium]|nr:L-threonylcarbamoyladenylate synthase [Candidatus Paceibacterota bacterium]
MEEIIKILKRKGVIVFPTDTVYGLLADYSFEEAVNKVYKIKKRDKKPLPIFVKDIKMAEQLALINKKQKAFLEKIWPGKITVILNRKNSSETIALRMPDYPLLNQLLKKYNKPLTGTSANISGKGSLTKIKEVRKQIKQADLIVDVGDLPDSFPSTIISLINYKIIRKGADYERLKNIQFN